MIAGFEIDGFVATCHGSIQGIPAADWDACGTAEHPLVQHRHLRILEECGIATAEVGFRPHPLILREADGTPAGCAPVYLKTASRGEMGVDLGLPLAHQRAVGAYYPKLQVEVPMVPTPGPRLLSRPDREASPIRRAILKALRHLATGLGASSVQIAHMTGGEQQEAVAAGFIPAEGNTFVWRSLGETSFADFVASMHQKGRYRIRHERKLAAALALTYERLERDRLGPELAPEVHGFYSSTFARYRAEPYLSSAYFEALFRSMPDVVDLLVARDGTAWRAMLVGLRAGSCYHVQHWGADEEMGSLLFEMFYQELEHAIGLGCTAVDFGPAGQHKTLRGIGVEATRHALWFAAPAFADIAAGACARRRASALQERERERLKLPFKDKANRAKEPA